MFRLPALRDARLFDAEPAGKSLGDLPEWDLRDLYTGPDAPEVARDFAWLDTACAGFAAAYEGRLATLDAATLLRCIQEYEAIDIVAGRLMSFAGLRYYQMTTDSGRAKFMADAQDRVTVATTPLVFFSLELNRIEDAAMEAQLSANADLARYGPVIDRMRAMRPHQLSDELEKFLHDQSTVGAAAWNRLFDETMAGLTFAVEGEDEPLPLEATLNLLTDPARARRQAAAQALARVFDSNIRLFARVHNTLAKDKEITDRWRKMPTPQHGRHLSNHVEPEVVEALRNAVVKAYPRLSHRYYALKAKWLGLERLEIWDRNAPLPIDAPRTIGWAAARETVMSAYADFDPRMADLAAPFFDKGWIDAGVKTGKAPGAFAHPTVSTVHPYVMLNYLGKPRDVMTLAHELGHGVHQRLAAGQGELLSATPLTLAETASVFGEMLTFQRLLAERENPGRAQDPAGRQGRGHDQHRRAPDRVLRFRMQAARGAARGRVDPRGHQRAVDVGAGRKPGAGVPFHGRVRNLLDLYPAFRPLAILRLCLCLWRRSGERALRRIPRRPRGVSGQVFRYAWRGRIQASQGAAGTVRA